MTTKINWLPQEEQLLKELKEKKGICSWKKIATIINGVCKDFSKTGKQYRDRYVNYIRFSESCPKVTEWSLQEQIKFLKNYFKFGAKWVQISAEMQGRSQNNLKNKFYGVIRKVSRRIHKFEKNMKPKPKKFINQKYIIRALDECRRVIGNGLHNEAVENIFAQVGFDLQQRLIKNFLNLTEETSDSEIQELIGLLKKLNMIFPKILGEQKSLNTNLQSQNEMSQSQQKSEHKTTGSQLHQFLLQKTWSEGSMTQDSWSDNQDSRMEIIQKFYKHPIKNQEPQDLMEDLCSILKCEYTPDSFTLL